MAIVSQFWDLIETWGFWKYIQDIMGINSDDAKDDDYNIDDKDNSNDKDISAQGHQS